MKKLNLALVFLIILILFPTGTITASPEEITRTIYIEDTSDLIQLSKDCSFDGFSQGLEVILTSDIDLNDKDFTPIPIFLGTFDGKGHTIKGLSITVEGSNQGFFRYLQEGGVIKNLNIEGILTPLGEKSTVGGIVGYNRGTIEDCSFSGYINGKDIIGGLAGWNGDTGMIIDSSSKGIIYGKRKVGGITGFNSGTILRSINKISVNTTIEEEDFDYGDLDLSLDNIDITQISRLAPDITDIGGIAGVNTGIIKNSKNEGVIGYPQVGYNVGGIAGRQTGFISDCSNYGSVQGRKEVSGIAGQMEPYINVLIPPSKLDALHEELDALDSTIKKMSSAAKHGSLEMEQKLSGIRQDIDTGKAHAKELMDMTEVLINKTSVIGVEILDRIRPLIKTIEGISEDVAKSIASIEESLKIIEKTLEKLPEDSLEAEELLARLRNIVSGLDEAWNKIEQSTSYINDAIEILLDNETEGVAELLGLAWENLRSATDIISRELSNLEELTEIIGELISSIDGEIGDELKEALDGIVDGIKTLERAFEKLNQVFSGIKDILDYMTGMPEMDFESISDDYQRVREGLLDSMADMSASLSEFMDTMFLQGRIMSDDMQSMGDQLSLVMGMSFEMMDELMNDEKSLDKIYQDISREDIDRKTEGKVLNCKNFGVIEGVLNVGGIAGAMAIEFESDPEDDLALLKDASLNAVFQTNAIIQKCENSGQIIAKKNNAGGIVGAMDLGYIIDCIASDSVESTDGDYVGGIAGRSKGPVVSSYAKSTLRGANYIGGISGYGAEIVDCYTMVKVEEAKSCIGAIAGDVEEDSTIKTNYFVSDNLSAIDGISYMDKAEPLSYNELISIADLPLVFKQLKLSFVSDGEIVRTYDVNYGESPFKIDLPPVPEKDGFYGEWEQFEEKTITADTVIQANYTPYLTVLESEERRNNTLPLVLVEGEFVQEASLILNSGVPGAPYSGRKKPIDQLEVIIPDDGNMTHTIRYLMPEGKRDPDLFALTNGKWVKINSHKDGKYLVFESPDNRVVFCAIEKGIPAWIFAALAGAAILAIGLAVLYLKKRKAAQDRPIEG